MTSLERTPECQDVFSSTFFRDFIFSYAFLFQAYSFISITEGEGTTEAL